MTDMPRCETCKWWVPYETPGETDWGDCGKSVIENGIDPMNSEALAHPIWDINGEAIAVSQAAIAAHQTYGCVQHEPADDSVLISRGSKRVQLDIAQMMRNADDAIANMEDRS